MAQNPHKDTDKFLGAYYILQEENFVWSSQEEFDRDVFVLLKVSVLAINHIYQQSAFTE